MCRPTGEYLIKCFLTADYAVDKALFIKDVEAYRSMRFESARRKITKLLYQRYVAIESECSLEYKKGASVFQIIQQQKMLQDEKSERKDLPVVSQSAPSQVSGAAPAPLPGTIGQDAPQAAATPPAVSPQPRGSVHQAASISPAAHTQTAAVPALPRTPGSGSVAPVASVGPSTTATATTTALQRDTKSMLSIGSSVNPIGVYGKSVRVVKERSEKGEAPKDLFDEVGRDVMNDLKLDVFPRFNQSEFYKKYIRTKWMEQQKVTVKDFTTFRVLGRGGFGAVCMCVCLCVCVCAKWCV